MKNYGRYSLESHMNLNSWLPTTSRWRLRSFRNKWSIRNNGSTSRKIKGKSNFSVYWWKGEVEMEEAPSIRENAFKLTDERKTYWCFIFQLLFSTVDRIENSSGNFCPWFHLNYSYWMGTVHKVNLFSGAFFLISLKFLMDA